MEMRLIIILKRKKKKNQIKYKDISFNKYNKKFFDNSKLNKTDANNKNNNDYTNIIMHKFLVFIKY